MSVDALYESASERLRYAEAKLLSRASRLREFGDYCYLQKWLMSVRGVDIRQAQLRMAEPPLVKSPIW